MPPEVLCTLAALYVLEEFFGEKVNEWTMIAQKAKAYLSRMKVAVLKEMDNIADYK